MRQNLILDITGQLIPFRLQLIRQVDVPGVKFMVEGAGDFARIGRPQLCRAQR